MTMHKYEQTDGRTDGLIRVYFSIQQITYVCMYYEGGAYLIVNTIMLVYRSNNENVYILYVLYYKKDRQT